MRDQRHIYRCGSDRQLMRGASSPADQPPFASITGGTVTKYRPEIAEASRLAGAAGGEIIPRHWNGEVGAKAQSSPLASVVR